MLWLMGMLTEMVVFFDLVFVFFLLSANGVTGRLASEGGGGAGGPPVRILIGVRQRLRH